MLQGTRSRGKDGISGMGENRSYYLYTGTWYRMFSPLYFSGVGYASVMLLLHDGRIDSTDVSQNGGVHIH